MEEFSRLRRLIGKFALLLEELFMSSANTSGSARILACSLCDQARKDACAISLVTSFVTAKALTGPRLIAGGNAPGRRATSVLTLTGSELSLECDPVRVETSCER